MAFIVKRETTQPRSLIVKRNAIFRIFLDFWSNTLGNFWNLTNNPRNKTISNFNVTYAGGQVDINWGEGIDPNIPSNTNINHTFGITTEGISIFPKNGANITNINCGTSSPRLSGTIDISAFTNLQDFRCINNDITAISGYENNNILTYLEFGNNKVSGTLPSLSAMTQLQNFRAYNNLLTGSIPAISANTNLINFFVDSNRFTGPLPVLTLNTAALRGFRAGNNRLTGFLPSSLTNMVDFRCENNFLSGSIPNLDANIGLQIFYCNSNQLTGFIPPLTACRDLISFWCDAQTGTNKLSGSIPSLNGLTNLIWFACNNNQLTGPMPSLSTNINLQRFYCNNNSLSGSITLTNANSALTHFYGDSNNFTGAALPPLTGFKQLVDFRVNSQLTPPRFLGPLPSLSGLNNLQFFYSNGNQHTGTIPDLTTNTSLLNYWCANNSITGNIPNLSTNTSLTLALFQNNRLTGFQGGSVSNTLGQFEAQTNLLRPTAVNSILAAFVAAGRTTGTPVINGNCILNLGGAGNFSPTGQGITDVTTLRDRGWTVTTGTL
jgi:hypothetical protein